MKLSELIRQAREIVDEHGDMDVLVETFDGRAPGKIKAECTITAIGAQADRHNEMTAWISARE